MMTKAVESSAASKNRLPPGEVARWVVAAAHHGVREAWIAKQPVLLLSEPSMFCIVQTVKCRLNPDATLQCVRVAVQDVSSQSRCTLKKALIPAIPLAGYLMEHAPGLGMFVLRRIGPKRAQAL